MKKLIFLLLLTTSFAYGQDGLPHEYKVTKDVVWASPKGFDLTMDIYTPDAGQKKYPVLIIYHGGGWLINNKSIMDDMAQYMAGHSRYVICNVNYRLLVDLDNTVLMHEIVEDALGALFWVKENISSYKGDPKKIAVTGDSAGGHLAEMVVLMSRSLSNEDFLTSKKFSPTYLPIGLDLDKVNDKGTMDVQAAIISYGAFDIYGNAKNGGFEKPSNFFWQMGGGKPRPVFGETYNVDDNPDLYKAVSPLYNIPSADERKLPPQLFTVGTKDNLTTPESIKAYIEKLEAAGQKAEYWEHQDRPHAFLDSGKNDFLKISFEEDAIDALDVMIHFLDSIFY